jgi:hypothetical protein
MGENIKRSIPPFWRSALGGIIGGLLWVMLLPAFRNNFHNSYYVYAFFYALFYMVVPSAFVGMMSGLIIWHLSNRIGKSLDVIPRLLLGAVFSIVITALIATVLYLLMKSNNNEPRIWLSYKSYIVLLGAMVGAFSGILMRRQSSFENGE